MKKLMVTAILLGMLAPLQAAILVQATKGDAAYLKDGQWKPLVKGQTLAEGTKISTGVKSSIILLIDGTLVTVKPLTSLKIYKNQSTADSRSTDLGLQFGKVKAKIEKVENIKTRFNVTTPVATSSVRGTEEEVSFGAESGMKIEVIEGIIKALNDAGVSDTVSGRLAFVLSGNESRSLDLLGDVKDTYVVETSPEGQSGDENEFAGQNGNDYIDGAGDIYNAVGGSGAQAHVSISGWNPPPAK